jgi:hypothetical protein
VAALKWLRLPAAVLGQDALSLPWFIGSIRRRGVKRPEGSFGDVVREANVLRCIKVEWKILQSLRLLQNDMMAASDQIDSPLVRAVNFASVDKRHDDMRACDFRRRNRKDIGGEHYHVGKHSYGKHSFFLLLEFRLR